VFDQIAIMMTPTRRWTPLLIMTLMVWAGPLPGSHHRQRTQVWSGLLVRLGTYFPKCAVHPHRPRTGAGRSFSSSVHLSEGRAVLSFRSIAPPSPVTPPSHKDP
jgi:hypothetical protein